MRARILKPKARQEAQEASGTAGQAVMFRVYRGKLRLLRDERPRALGT